jgi:hypothetical protein
MIADGLGVFDQQRAQLLGIRIEVGEELIAFGFIIGKGLAIAASKDLALEEIPEPLHQV